MTLGLIPYHSLETPSVEMRRSTAFVSTVCSFPTVHCPYHPQLSQSPRSKKNKRDKKKHKVKPSQPPTQSYNVTPIVPVTGAADKEMVEVAEEALELITVVNGEVPSQSGNEIGLGSRSEVACMHLTWE